MVMRRFATKPVADGFPTVDPLYTYVQLGPHAIEQTRKWAQKANHHKGVNVGAMALLASREGNIALFGAANQNLEPGDNPSKACAEQIALQKGIHKGFPYLVGMWVSGPPQPDKHSGIFMPTLPPCGDCRDVMYLRPVIEHNPQALITTVHPQKDEYQIHILDELGDAITEEDQNYAAENLYADPGLQRWEEGKVAFSFYRNNPELFPEIVPVQAARLAITVRL